MQRPRRMGPILYKRTLFLRGFGVLQIYSSTNSAKRTHSHDYNQHENQSKLSREYFNNCDIIFSGALKTEVPFGQKFSVYFELGDKHWGFSILFNCS